MTSLQGSDAVPQPMPLLVGPDSARAWRTDPALHRTHTSELRRAGLLAVGSFVAWVIILTAFHPQPVVDEAKHLQIITRFCGGNWTVPPDLPMPATYHLLVSIPARVLGPSLVVVRGTSVLMAAMTVALVVGILARRQAGAPGMAVLHYAWHPVLFPLAAMAYTEAASVLLVVGAIYAQVRRRFALSGGILLLACLVRQSNLMWVVFMALWAVGDLRRTDPRAVGGPTDRGPWSFVRLSASRIWAHAAVLGLAGAFFVANGSLTLGDAPENRAALNPGQFYVFALFVLGLWAPIWLGRLGDDWRALWRWLLGHPVLGVAVSVMVVGLAAILVIGFTNPHPWNGTLYFARNWPLRLMSASVVARVVGVVCLFGATGIVGRFTLAQPNRRTLALVWVCSLCFLAPHFLVEPRYYIIPTLLVNLFTEYSTSQAQRLARWHLCICVLAGAGILAGGMW